MGRITVQFLSDFILFYHIHIMNVLPYQINYAGAEIIYLSHLLVVWYCSVYLKDIYFIQVFLIFYLFAIKTVVFDSCACAHIM